MTDADELKLTSATTVYLSLGSNMGDRVFNLTRAIDLLGRPLKITRMSSVFETAPVGVPEQADFLNMVIEAQTHIAPPDLLRLIKGVEQVIGRGKAGSDEPRVIDIDILLYGDRRIDTPELVIPHPRMTKRAFVLVPLCELAPRLKEPKSRRTVEALLASLGAVQTVKLFSGTLTV
ncbi:2-amino-4-hydroxy-6-hydroxymethyldihydropteridine pyrophosphokinase [Dehalogenimonas lykanthroporepellens BL-DC-9]|jgi:2-amino-4-hydroxy-6-hydroxymethyldihydropteridine diphosphokinase|nr:2-amino-4-hydroxy-6-hydroxymethyldihydropteridine pyrophosphokinase [Dehalogenimonas lykanthroporepellens BL-DC-9]